MPILLILAACAVMGGLDNIAVVRFQRDLRFDMEFRLLFVPRVLQFVVGTAAALTLRSYWALIIGIVIGRAARSFMTYWVQQYRPRLTLSRWRDLASFSFWSWASSMAYMVWNRCDAFVLAPAVGMGQLGVFLLAGEIGLLPTTELIEPATRALYAGVAAARNRGTDAIGLTLPLMAILLMLVLPIGLGLSATSGFVVAGLLGPSWAVGRPVIAIFALLCAISPITYVAATVLNAAGHVRQSFWAVAGASAVRVGALVAVARYQRLDWAALAIFAVVLCEAVMFMTQLARRGRLDWREALPGVLRTLTACAVVAGVVWTTGLGWTEVSYGSVKALAIGVPIGLGCIAGCACLQIGMWRLAGCPRGPEATFAGLVGDFAARARRRIGFA